MRGAFYGILRSMTVPRRLLPLVVWWVPCQFFSPASRPKSDSDWKAHPENTSNALGESTSSSNAASACLTNVSVSPFWKGSINLHIMNQHPISKDLRVGNVERGPFVFGMTPIGPSKIDGMAANHDEGFPLSEGNIVHAARVETFQG